MEQRFAHPLDIELLSFVLGDADVALAAEVEDHLGTCLLCRIHTARIRRSGVNATAAAAGTYDFPTVAAEVLAVLDPKQRPNTIEPGQVWLAGNPNRLVVFIDSVDTDDNVANVFAATLDVDAADHTSLITPLPRLDRPMAVFTSVGGTVAFDRLDHYIEDLAIHDQIEQLIEATDNGTTPAGLTVGAPILGGTDERLEFRQLLADDLAALDPITGESDPPADEPAVDGLDEFDQIVSGMRDELSADLATRRGAWCEVTKVDEFLVGSLARSMSLLPVATVQELTCRVLVVSSDIGPTWATINPQDAYKLLLQSGASTLAVAAQREPYDTCIFEPPLLREAFELPDAGTKLPPRAIWEARPMIKALFDYLDDGVLKIEPASPPQRAPSTPDLSAHLPTQTQAAIEDLKKIRSMQGKHRALKRLSDQDAVQLATALSVSDHLDDVLDRIEQITGP
jgi:hypothetical protein